VRVPAPAIGPARAALAGLALAALTLTACGAPTPATAPTAAADPAAQDESRICVWAVPAGRDDGTYCQRVMDDERRRNKLTAEQRAEAAAAAAAVGQAIGRMSFGCAEPVTGECLAQQARQRLFPPTGTPEQTIDRVRRTLAAAGYPDAVVRRAGPKDLASRDTIVYAVRAGGGCVVGTVAADGRGGGETRVLGTLPHGRCLD
jgi:hypothetical protein